MDAHAAYLPSFNWTPGYSDLALTRIDLRRGPVLEVGAGTGAVTQALLAHAPGAQIWCVEPDDDARGILRARVQCLGAAGDVTVLPRTIGEVLDAGWLPGGIGTVLLVGMAYFLDADEHTQMWRGLLQLLAEGATVVLGPVVPDDDHDQYEPRPLRRVREARLGATTLEWWRENLRDGSLRHVFRTVLEGAVIEEVEGFFPAPRCTTAELLAAVPETLVVEQEAGLMLYLRRG